MTEYLKGADWQLPTLDSPLLSRALASEIMSVQDFFKTCTLEPFTTISDVLSEAGMALLEDLPVPDNSKCPREIVLTHPVTRELINIMGRISLSNPEYNLSPDRVVATLRNEAGENIYLPPHRDLLDGHAVVFNWGVEGDLRYVIDGAELPITNNQIVILNGAANWQEVTPALDAQPVSHVWRFGGTTAMHSVQGSGPTSRNRLLVYADGQDTEFTQLFEDEYGPVPAMRDNLLFVGLRPSLGIYIE